VRSSKGLFQRIHRNAVGDTVAIDAEVGGATTAIGAGAGTSRRDSAPAGAKFSAKFERDRLGLELGRQLPGGIRAQWQRDSLGRPLRQEIWRGDESRGARQYVWDMNYRLTRVIDAMTGPIDYTHDGFGNLAAAAYADGRVELRLPDAVGNLFQTPERTDRRYGPAGELLESRDARGVTSYAYDSEGNLVKRVDPDGAVWLYAWNGSGLLARVTRPNGHTVEFTYDALARRIAKLYRGKTTRWIWDGNVPLHEWVERAAEAVDEDFSVPAREEDSVAANARALKALLAGRPAQGPPAGSDQGASLEAAASAGSADAPITWLFEPDRRAPLAKLVGGKTFGIVTDHLGTPRAMFDERGAEVWAADMDTYGDLHNVRGARGACPFRWPGQYEDVETGLYYNRFRYYSPGAGEYVNQDRSRTEGGYALYAYVPDPLSWTDRLGLTPLDEGGHSVYGLYDKGSSTPYYVGITNDPERRQAEHIESGRLSEEGGEMKILKQDVSYAEARGTEQALIEQHGTLTGTIGEPISATNRGNKVNSFDKSRTDERGLRFNQEYLKVKGCRA
jgi:RHS repeat-associated protein